MATADKLITVAENVPKVYHAGQLNVVENAECLKASKSGSAILIDDISPVTHEMGVRVRSKNLFEGTLNSGIYSNENFKISIADSTKFKSMKIYLPVGTYTLASSVSLMLVREVVDGVYGSIAKSGNTYTFSVTIDGDVGFSFRRSDETDWDDSDNVWLNEGTVATAYTPYVDLTTVKVTRRGKNLFSGLTKGIGIHSTNGSEITNSNYAASDYIPVDFNANTNYYISGLPTTISNFVAAYNANKEFLGRTGGSVNSNYKMASAASFQSGTPQGTGDISYLRVCCYKTSANTGTINDIDGCNIQLEVGSAATEYEPYNSATFTPTADGIVEGVTSLYPNTALLTDTDGVIIDCDYYKDIDKAFNELTTSVALSGGE